VDIREIRIREDVLEKMLDWWRAEWGKRIAIKEAESEREAVIMKADAERIAHLKRTEAEVRSISAMEAVKARARGEMISQIADTLTRIDRDVAYRFIEVVEHLSREMVTDNIVARRYIEMMESLVKSEGVKKFIVGEGRQLLEPGQPHEEKDRKS
jgi:regulator of protease activity HflC (stomatin/prohibitin superfamily)